MPEHSDSLTKITEMVDLLNINQAVVDGKLVDLSVVFSASYKQNMEMLKLSAWKLLITKKAFDRYIKVENNFMAGLLRETKSKRFCAIILYLYAEFKSTKILASTEITFLLEMPISVPQWDCSEALERNNDISFGDYPLCTLKVLIKRQTNHLIIMLPGEN